MSAPVDDTPVASHPFETIGTAPERRDNVDRSLTTTPASTKSTGDVMATANDRPNRRRELAPDDPRHGTTAGYNAHYKLDALPCDDCKTAKARYEKLRHYEQTLGLARTVPSRGPRRRIRALQRLGWSLSVIAEHAGWESPQALQYVMKSDTIYRDSHDRIGVVYDALSMKIPPFCSGTVRARNRAIRLGYLPPLMWDDIDLDESPADCDDDLSDDIDEVKVRRVLDGIRQDCTDAEKEAVLAQWTGSSRELYAITGWNVHREINKRNEAA